jgi:phenylpyruvate tautomerase PptA (4-oxalocrotonate tautomerase family)
MPLWKIYHPAGAYTEDDKREFSAKITELYQGVPIPKFYVVVIFEETQPGNVWVGGDRHDRFVRFKIDQFARTIPGPVLREWWINTVDALTHPWVKDRGYEWEISIDEPPSDLWTLSGERPPPFESFGEKRWTEENRASPYSLQEKLPVNLHLAPGTHDSGD